MAPTGRRTHGLLPKYGLRPVTWPTSPGQNATLMAGAIESAYPSTPDMCDLRSKVSHVPISAVTISCKVRIQTDAKSSSAAASPLSGFLQLPIPNCRGDETGEPDDFHRISGYAHHSNGL